jgi:hypothetical protein
MKITTQQAVKAGEQHMLLALHSALAVDSRWLVVEKSAPGSGVATTAAPE